MAEVISTDRIEVLDLHNSPLFSLFKSTILFPCFSLIIDPRVSTFQLVEREKLLESKLMIFTVHARQQWKIYPVTILDLASFSPYCIGHVHIHSASSEFWRSDYASHV